MARRMVEREVVLSGREAALDRVRQLPRNTVPPPVAKEEVEDAGGTLKG